MKSIGLTFVFLISFVTSTIASDVETKKFEDTDQPFKFHGRLMLYNGTPSVRIWIIGTKRLVGVPGRDIEPAEMPDELTSLISWGTQIYADFHVTPLTKYKKGEMQMVRIDAVENLVIYKNGKFSEKRRKL